MVVCANPNSLATLLLVGALATLACKGDSKPTKAQARGTTASTATSGQTSAAVDLPGRIEASPSGVFTPAAWLDGGIRVAATTVAGKTVVAVARVDVVTLYDGNGTQLAAARVPGTPQVLRFGNIDSDPEPELVAAAGLGRDTREAPAVLMVANSPSWQPVPIELPKTHRNQIADVAFGPSGELLVAHFLTKYKVGLSRASVGKPLVELGTKRMVSGIDFVVRKDKNPSLAVARVYGDALKEPGLVQLLDGDQWSSLPSLRGARAVRWSDRDQVLVVSDGWHREYRAKGRALLTRLSFTDAGWQRVILANVAGVSGFDSLSLGDIDGDGITDVVAAGDGPAIAVSLAAGGDRPARSLGGGSGAFDTAIADLDADGSPEVLIVGADSGIWRPK